MFEDIRKKLRKEKIEARESLTKEERDTYSAQIVQRILASSEFQKAQTVMIYRGIRGEVRLNLLEMAKESKGKQFLFPLCLPEREMAALAPFDEEAWQPGSYGIMEPSLERSKNVMPQDIDFIIAPCTSFDETCNRMGMGGGYYDRFLPKCTKAMVAAVAFEIQKADRVPMEPWDKAVDLAFTEKKTYFKNQKVSKNG